MVELLLRRRAKVTVPNDRGLMPLHTAASIGDTQMVELLIRYKAPLDEKLKPIELCGRFNRGKLLPNGTVHIATYAWAYWTPLHLAALGGHVRTAEALLEHGAKVNKAVGERGLTPLHCAVIAKHLDMVRLLLRYGASVKAKDVDSRTPLDYAETPEMIAVLAEASGSQ